MIVKAGSDRHLCSSFSINENNRWCPPYKTGIWIRVTQWTSAAIVTRSVSKGPLNASLTLRVAISHLQRSRGINCVTPSGIQNLESLPLSCLNCRMLQSEMTDTLSTNPQSFDPR